jgi:hypothetical protein
MFPIADLHIFITEIEDDRIRKNIKNWRWITNIDINKKKVISEMKELHFYEKISNLQFVNDDLDIDRIDDLQEMFKNCEAEDNLLIQLDLFVYNYDEDLDEAEQDEPYINEGRTFCFHRDKEEFIEELYSFAKYMNVNDRVDINIERWFPHPTEKNIFIGNETLDTCYICV